MFNDIIEDILNCRRGVCTSIPNNGAQSYFLGKISSLNKVPIIFIANDDNEIKQIISGLNLFFKDIKYLYFPAWDCRPYDGLSPSVSIQAQRSFVLDAISRNQAPDLILTTVNAICQKVSAGFPMKSKVLKKGDEIRLTSLQHEWNAMGYIRTPITESIGTYSVHGGIIDIFSASLKTPVRIDLFGDVIESIRCFNPDSQISNKHITEIRYSSVKEWQINDESKHRYIANVRLQHGRSAVASNEIIKALKAGIYDVAGIEHCLPLFVSELVSFSSCFKTEYKMILGLNVKASLKLRNQQIEESYNHHHLSQKNKSDYLNIAPDQLYLNLNDILALSDNNWNLETSISPNKSSSIKVYNCSFATALDLSVARLNNKTVETIIENQNKKSQDYATTILCQNQNSKQRIHEYFNQIKDKDDGYTARIQLDSLDNSSLTQISNCINIVEGAGVDGFTLVDNDKTWYILSEHDLFGSFGTKLSRKRPKKQNHIILNHLQELSIGDLLVDEQFGIGRFLSLETVNLDDIKHDCVKLSYYGGDNLYVPVESMDRLSRYSFNLNQEAESVKLDRLGQDSWQRRKAKAKKDLLASAETLLNLAAERKLLKAPVMETCGGMDEFSKASGFVETDDQKQAIEDCFNDLLQDHPTERLICGDAGNGKTEVALQTSFLTVMNGYQVLILAPTTLLVRQHLNTFKQRFKNWPVQIASLSRLIKPKEAQQTVKDLEDGKVDIVIGTHALLSSKIKVKNIGLIVIDEEQHFGVKQKEALKKLAQQSHILLITATPIPRTLQMAFSGLHDLSIIATAPADRLDTRCFVCSDDSPAIRDAIRQELERNGQVFYICPHISDLKEIAKKVNKWFRNVPQITVHGQLPINEIDSAISDFIDQKARILISTPIVESGLDIPKANTIIIHRSDRFGFAQLYQLRGRVGRGKERGWCYYTTINNVVLNQSSRRRIELLLKTGSDASGLSVAAHDLDSRGSGNVLGDQQSGHIKEIGVQLYQKMLKETIENLKKKTSPESISWSEDLSPSISLGIDVFISDTLAKDVHSRMRLYREASQCKTALQLAEVESGWQDRFGRLPEETKNIFKVLNIKLLCIKAGIERFDAGKRGGVIRFYKKKPKNIKIVLDLLKTKKDTMVLRSDMSIQITAKWHNVDKRCVECVSILQKMNYAT